ncbi:MAG: recombination protein RecR, partial [Candidatus Paceibacterota bacterium]
MNYPKPIQNLIDHFTKFPGVGPRTAARYVFYLLKTSPKQTKNFQQALSKLHQNTDTCNFCFKSYKSNEQDLCKICRDKTRDRSKLCIVEKEADLLSIEETNA